MIINRIFDQLQTIRFIVALSLILGLFPAQLQAGEVLLDKIAAVVNDEVIMLSELKNAALKVRISGGSSLSDEAIIKNELDKLIFDKVQIQRAKGLGIIVDDAKLNDAMRRIAKQNNLDLRTFRLALIKEGLDYKDFRESIRDKLYIDLLKRRKNDTSKKITETEVDDLIKAQSYRLNKDVQYHLLDILIPAPNGISVGKFNSIHKRAFNLRKQLLINPHEISPKLLKKSGASSFDLGWKLSQNLSPAYVRTLSLMGIGELSTIIRDARGFHILKILEQRGGLRKITQQARVRHILIPADRENARVKAIQLRQKILAGESFAALAKKYSADTLSAQDGGKLDMIDPNTFVPSFANAVKTLPLNTLSQPIKTRFGWHILEVLERKDIDLTRDTLKKQAEISLTKRNESEEYQNWLQGLRDEAYVDIKL